jgi:transcriptional regulator with XRE-family HTH domain
MSPIARPEAADALMVSRNTIGNYLAGRTTPKPVFLRKWAEHTGVPLEWLTGILDNPDLRNADSRCTERMAA